MQFKYTVVWQIQMNENLRIQRQVNKKYIKSAEKNYIFMD